MTFKLMQSTLYDLFVIIEHPKLYFKNLTKADYTSQPENSKLMKTDLSGTRTLELRCFDSSGWLLKTGDFLCFSRSSLTVENIENSKL